MERQKGGKGEHCLIAWPKVTRPKKLRCFRILDIQKLSWALRVRWLWLKKATGPSKPWVPKFSVYPEVVFFIWL